MTFILKCKDVSQLTIGKSLKRMEFETKIIHGKTRYHVVIADYDRQRRERESLVSNKDELPF